MDTERLEAKVMSSYVLQLVQLDGVPRDHESFGDDLERAVDTMEARQAQCGPASRSGCHWRVIDVDDTESGDWDRDRMRELEVSA
jgi:hypothetical protein